MDNIPQVFCELDRLAHVSVEYSSTLFSYQTMTDIFSMLKENILKEIINREEEMKLFSTQQGVGLRKIMFQHYQRILKVITNEYNIFAHVTQSIYEKQKVMENSINFIDPIIKLIGHKTEVLERQLKEINDKMIRLNQKKIHHKDSSISLQSFLRHDKNQAQSQIFQTQQKGYQKSQYVSKKNNQPFTLFSSRKFDSFETQGEFSQAESFLQLKLQQVQQYIKIQKELTSKTIKKIFDIFDETMGKGLERLEKSILDLISIKGLQTPLQKIKLPLKNEQKMLSNSSSSADLSCHESMDEIMKQNIDLQKFRFVRKRLYESNQNKKNGLTQSQHSKSSSQSQEFGISPTFKFTCPLIIQSVQQISQFAAQRYQTYKNAEKKEKETSQNQQYHLYDSFCKENVNMINI